jgi:serine protease Do
MYGDSSMGELNLAGFAELKAMLADPKQGCDPAWRPMTRQESRRLCWLGVEFEPISEELAERLGCAEETRGGNVGLIVSTVYPESPAAKLGIKPQDILLRLKVEGLGDPLPLVARYAAASEGWSRSSMMGRMGGMGGAGRTWKSRGNFLTRLLTEAGPGRKAEITYLVAGGKKELKTGAFELAWAPEDYDSAEKYKDEKLGMAVKPITYEVREALGLKADDPGVVISWIEQGGSAQVARLAPYMLIVAVEGKPVRSAAEFKKAVEEVRAQKKDSVKMQVTAMGKSRFADLKLGD